MNLTLKKFLLIIFCFHLAIISSTIPFKSAQAEDVYEVVFRKKQEAKKQSRAGWNLSDWLIQRDRRRIQDLWLAMHTPVPYEFILEGNYRWFNEPKNQADHRYALYAFARIFGLGLEMETEPKRYNALFLLRLLGLYSQGTNITLHGGIRAQNEPAYFRSPFYGFSTTLYLARFFGFEGTLRKYGNATSNGAGQDFDGVMKEANLFIDFKFIRIFFGYLGTPMDPDRGEGYQVGTRIYF